MFAALIGVAGVFVGAVIALMQAWFFERRRERLAARAARRLVAEEMTTLAADATAARQLDRVEVGGGRNIDIVCWSCGKDAADFIRARSRREISVAWGTETLPPPA